MKTLATGFGLLALGSMALHGAEVAILLAVAGGGGFVVGCLGRNLWKGGP